MSEKSGGYVAGTAQVVGVLVFVGGVILIALTFSAARRFFEEPSYLLPALQTPPKGDPVQNLTLSIITIVIKIAMLFAMMLAGSLVAARGIQLFGAGRQS